MNKFGLFVLLWVLFSFLTTTSAQIESWQFKDNCAIQATTDDWVFSGTILATGYGGIHGFNAHWETPRVMARIDRFVEGRLSPDNRWYAVPQERVIYAESYNHEHVIEAINVYSTFPDDVVFIVDWQNSWLQMWGYRELFWLDNEHILYEESEDFVHSLDELVTLNPFDDSATSWQAAVDILDGGSGFHREYVQFPSPDFTRTVYYGDLYDVASGDNLIELETSNNIAAWRPDSSAFVTEVANGEAQAALAMFDRDGNAIEIVLDGDPLNLRNPQNMQWSSDGRYLGLHPRSGTLQVFDFQDREVRDSCLSSATGFAWSPDATQIAFLEPGNGVQDVYVLDLPSWSYRAVARHIVQGRYSDTIIGWRNE